MPEYTVTIKIPNAGNKQIPYSVVLVDSYEDYPEDYFRIEENRLNLCQAIQNQSARQISQEQLKRLISEWIQEIKLGRRRTTIILDLVPEGMNDRDRVSRETAFSQAPKATSTNTPPPPPKKPNPNQGKQKTPAETTTVSGTSKKSNPSSQKDEQTKTEVWSDTNEADF